MRAPLPLLFAGGWVLAWSLACSAGYKPFEGDEPCTQVAYSVAAVTYDCTGDADLANQRFRDFQADHACSDAWKASLDAIEPAFDCAVTVRQTPCDAAEAYGDDLDAWLVDPSCEALFQPRDGTGSTADTGGGR